MTQAGSSGHLLNPSPGPGDCAAQPAFLWKLWLYTNYDCNLKCSYCVAKSGPNVARRALDPTKVCCLVDEAVSLGFSDIFFTGGEPFLLNDIYEMLVYSAQRVKTTVLTNAMLLRGARLDKLVAAAARVPAENLVIQVSLDGGRPEDHDAYRGKGSWGKAVAGIRLLQERGFRVRIGTTETPVNSAHLDKLCAFHRSLGIPDEDHFIRPLAKRGYSRQGLELDMGNLVPEVTVNLDGIFWHPLATDADMQISRKIFPLADAVAQIQAQLEVIAGGGTPLVTFT
jgi:sulfatase maturation enzyme AslB (radical SAM superfamily)